MDLVKVKIGMIDREEREIRKNYYKEWSRMEDVVRKNSVEWRKLKTEVGEIIERQRQQERTRLEKKKNFLITTIREKYKDVD